MRVPTFSSTTIIVYLKHYEFNFTIVQKLIIMYQSAVLQRLRLPKLDVRLVSYLLHLFLCQIDLSITVGNFFGAE